MKRRFLRWSVVTALVGALALALSGVANASLTTHFVFNGNGGYSADGLGQEGTGNTIQAEVPAGSTVVKAFLHGTYYQNIPDAAARTIDFDGTVYPMDLVSSLEVVPGFFLSTTRADVTAQVAAKVGGGGGITDFAVNTDPVFLDGVALTVVYSNPSLPEGTIAVLDGSASTSGDTATFILASPLDKTIPGFQAIMSLGSGFGFQGGVPADHTCGGVQFSIVDVNSQRMTSCAGNYDDGLGSPGNGELITVGGVGDSTANPADPNTQTGTDDELYNLDPFLSQGDTSIEITSSNPSNDDNLFLAVISITAEATVTNEDCDNGIDDDGDGLVDGDDPDCQILRRRRLLVRRGAWRRPALDEPGLPLRPLQREAARRPGDAFRRDLVHGPREQEGQEEVRLDLDHDVPDRREHGRARGRRALQRSAGDVQAGGDRRVTDTFSITLSNGYSASGNVTSGRGINIKPCDPPEPD